MSIWGNYIKISSNIKLFINSNNKKYLQAFHHRISPELAQSFSLWIFFLLALISASNLPLQSCSKFLPLLVTPLPTRLWVPAGISGLPGGSPTGAGESRANLGGKFLVKIHYITWTLMMVAEATSHQTWTWTWCSGKNSRLRFSLVGIFRCRTSVSDGGKSKSVRYRTAFAEGNLAWFNGLFHTSVIWFFS